MTIELKYLNILGYKEDVCIIEEKKYEIINDIIKGICDKYESKIINIIYVSAKQIQVLNKKYRKQTYKPTVLTFQYSDFAEIYICIEVIAQEIGLNNNKDLSNEVMLYILYSITNCFDITKEIKEKLYFDIVDEYKDILDINTTNL